MKQLWMDWQTFAEAAEAGQETGGETGGQAAPDAGEQEAFSALIRGQYKEQFDARVQKILDGRLRGLRQENARLRQEVQARRESQAGAVLRLQAEEGRIRQVYPDFDWRREMASPRFGRLVTAGVDGRTAYEIVHRQELLKAAMGYAAAQARSQMARSIASGGGRAAENRGDSRSVIRSDPRGLTSRELADIRKRVQDGEKIRF